MIRNNNILLRSLSLGAMGVGSVLLMLSHWGFTLPHLNFHCAWQKQLLRLFDHTAVLEDVGLVITLPG